MLHQNGDLEKEKGTETDANDKYNVKTLKRKQGLQLVIKWKSVSSGTNSRDNHDVSVGSMDSDYQSIMPSHYKPGRIL